MYMLNMGGKAILHLGFIDSVEWLMALLPPFFIAWRLSLLLIHARATLFDLSKFSWYMVIIAAVETAYYFLGKFTSLVSFTTPCGILIFCHSV